MNVKDLTVGKQYEWQVKEGKWRLVEVMYLSDWAIVIKFVTGEQSEPELPVSIVNEPDKTLFREIDLQREIQINGVMKILDEFDTDLDYIHVGCKRDVAAKIVDGGYTHG